MHTSELRIELLGGFRVRVDNRTVPDDVWRRRKPAALLKLLALAPSHRLHREQLIDALWPDLELSAGGANLRKAIHHARNALDGVMPGAGALIASDGDAVAIAACLSLDVEQFRACLAAARRTADVDAYRAALDLYAGELLPEDRYAEWATAPRRELHLDYLAGLTELAGMVEARGDVDLAIDAARRLVGAEPTREESHALLMRLYALSGRRGDALRQFEHLARVLDEELGTEPSADTQRLYEEIRTRRTDEPELTADLWERVGDLRMLAGDAPGAAKAFDKALEPGGAADTVARIERKSAEAWLMHHRPDVAAVHLDAAEARSPEPAERGRLLRARANHAWEQGDIEAARSFADQALQLAIEHGTDDDRAGAHEAVAIVSHFSGKWRDGVESELERMARGELGSSQLARVFDIHHCIGQYHLYGDGLSDSVEEYARRILDHAEELGAVRAQAFAWCLLGESLLLQARWDEADGCLSRSCELHMSLGSRSGALPWQRRAELAICRGAFDDVGAYLRQASAIATVSVMAQHMWGRIHATSALASVEQRDPDRAVQSIQAAAAAAARYGSCPTCSALLNPVAAEAYAMIADAETARCYADVAAQVAATFGSAAWRAMADSAAGSASLAEGDTAAALECFDSAREHYEIAHQPYWAQRSARLSSLVPM